MNMRLLVFMLFISSVNLVVCYWDYMKFPLELLLPDLEAIDEYITNNPGPFQAVVRWPKGISFRIREDQGFLVVSGNFYTQKFLMNTLNHRKLYYRKGLIYKTPLRGQFSLDVHSSVYYRKDVNEDYIGMPEPGREPCLYINYISLNKIKKLIRPFHEENTAHLKSVLDEFPSAFLATGPKCYPFFVEYTMCTRCRNNIQADGKLRVLIGIDKGPKFIMSESVEASKLVFDQNTGSLSVCQSPECDAPLENVFAVRMASTGFVADVRSSGIKMLSSGDLEMLNPNQHRIPANELLTKVRNVEPRFSYGIHDVAPRRRPKNVVFQVRGHALVKRVKILNDGSMDRNCPLVIRYKTKERNFLCGSRRAKEICTDDSNLWVEIVNGRPVHLTNELITLKYL